MNTGCVGAGAPEFMLLPASLYISRVHSEAPTHCISDISAPAALPGKVASKEPQAMASVPKLLLLSLLFFLSCRSHIAHAGDDGSYKVLSIGFQSLRTASVCSESTGAVLSVHAPAVSFPLG